MSFLLGIDIGATYIKYGVFTPGRLLMKSVESTRTADNLPEFVTQVLHIAHEQIRPHKLAAIGIGVPAFISKKENRVELAPNIRFLRDINLQKELSARTYLPVILGNDANLAALGEYLSLPKPRPESFVHVTLGTGVGAGIILRDNLWVGECGFAGELGHIAVNPEGRPCGCGSRGCLETESSETGIVKTYKELSGQTGAISAADIFQHHQNGDAHARKAFERAGYYLGILFAVIANFLNPSMISIGGGVAAAGEAILEPARREMQQRIHRKIFHCTPIHLATQGNNAGVLGAARLAQALIK